MVEIAAPAAMRPAQVMVMTILLFSLWGASGLGMRPAGRQGREGVVVILMT